MTERLRNHPQLFGPQWGGTEGLPGGTEGPPVSALHALSVADRFRHGLLLFPDGSHKLMMFSSGDSTLNFSEHHEHVSIGHGLCR